MTENVAYIDYTKCKACRKCVTECPKHAIIDVNFPAPAKKPEAPQTIETPAPKPVEVPAAQANS